MSIGLVCQYLEPIIKRSGNVEYNNISGEKTLQYKQYLKNLYSKEHIEEVWYSNCINLLSLIKRIYKEGYRVFRFSSSLFPLYDVEQKLLYNSKAKFFLKDIGDFVKDNNIRITTHPDQFVLLSSNREEVNNKSILMLEHYGWIFDSMELPKSNYYCINIHGGTKGNSNILISNINKLSYSVKSRLTLENDERSYSIKDLYKVYLQTGIPIVFDSHHHSFNAENLSTENALNLSIETWIKIKPLTHLSNSNQDFVNGSFFDRRKHSDYVYSIPEYQKLLNNENKIDFEFKMKNFAIKKAIKDFDIAL